MRAPMDIDYTSTTWGHNYEIIGHVIDGKARLCCWHANGVREGDRLLWKTNYGVAVAKVVNVRKFGDPQDMYSVDVEIVERRDSEGNVLKDPNR